jgi:hypothetical protein
MRGKAQREAVGARRVVKEWNSEEFCKRQNVNREDDFCLSSS